MPSLPFFNRRFTPSWQMTLLALCFILLFLRLGFWQIQRAHEKEKMLANYAARLHQMPVHWGPDKPFPEQYQNISVSGHYLPDVFLLDNQHYQHQFGYHVLSPLLLDNGEVIMFDRGWIRGDPTRQQFPDLQTLQTTMHLKGSAYYPTVTGWALGPMLEKKGKHLTIVEQIDTKKLSQILQKRVYPFIIRLDKAQAHGFVRDWAVVSMPPERHLAYALQWFSMALVILIIFIALNLKKK